MAELTPTDLLAQLQADSVATDNSAASSEAQDPTVATGQEDESSSAGASPDEREYTAEEWRAIAERQAQQIRGSQDEFRRIREEMAGWREVKQTNDQLLQTLNNVMEQARAAAPQPGVSQADMDPEFESILSDLLTYMPDKDKARRFYDKVRPQFTLDDIDRRLTEREKAQQAMQQKRSQVDAWVMQTHQNLAKPEFLQKTMEHYIRVQQQGFYEADPQGLYTRYLPNGQPYDLRVLNDAAFRAERDLGDQRTKQARESGIQEEATRKDLPTLPGAQGKAPATPPLDPDVRNLIQEHPQMRALLETMYSVRDPRAITDNVAKLLARKRSA